MTPPQEQDPRPEDLDPLPGRVIAGNFRIDKLIGSGAMGNVYRAEQLSLGKAVAVKVLHAHLMSDEKLVLRFKREAKSASQLNHPHSIQIIDSGQDQDGTLYIAMELLAGRDLAQVIRDEFPLALPRVLHIMAQVLEALDEAHTQGIVHRDLKPSNIMLIERRGEKDFVKVCDFGIAKAITSDGKDEDRQAMLTIQGLVCGTPEYMAPEQARSEPIDGRVDLYAAAVILYQLVTGDIPFRADTPMGIVSRHLAEAPKPPSLRRPDLPIPKLIDEIVLRGMQKTRELRFPTAVAFREALDEAARAMTGQPAPLSQAARASMPTTPAFGGVYVEGRPASAGGAPAARQAPGTTADLPARRRGRAYGNIAAAIFGVGLAVVAVVVVAALRSGPAPREPAVAPAAVAPAAPAPHPNPLPAPRGEGEGAQDSPPVAEAPAPAPVPAPAAPAPRERSKHHKTVARAPAAEPAGDGAPVVKPAPAATVVAAPVAPVEAPARGAREVLGEGEKLLGQGEVREACARGEEAKHLSPKLPQVYKFLGKCYMRAGEASQANDNYRKYLELAPNASDAPFIKSIVK